MAVTKIKPIKSTLSKALDYIENPDKTDGKMLVSSFGCSYETADIEFGFTLSQALQKGNNLAFHLIQSFEPGEADAQTAHEIGRQLADAVTKGQHEYVLTTHIDKGHVHNHIIFCAVNFVDHRKYVSNKRTYYGIRNMSDKLCRENGLSVVVPGKGSKGKSYAEYQAEKTGTSWKGKLKTAVDALIPQVSSFEELLQRLQAAGYEIKPGKYVSCRAPGQERFTRLKTLGADYTEEAIRERIAGKRTRAVKAPKQQRGGVSLLIDIENSIKAQQSRGYEQWAKIHNLKQAAKTMNFLTEHRNRQSFPWPLWLYMPHRFHEYYREFSLPEENGPLEEQPTEDRHHRQATRTAEVPDSNSMPKPYRRFPSVPFLPPEQRNHEAPSPSFRSSHP